MVLVASNSGVVHFSLSSVYFPTGKTVKFWPVVKTGYFYVILKVPLRRPFKNACWKKSLLLVMTKWYHIVLKIRAVWLLSAQSWPCFRLCQAKGYGRPFQTDVKSLVTELMRMKMNYCDFFVVDPFVNAKSCSDCGQLMVYLPGCCCPVLVPVSWTSVSPVAGLCIQLRTQYGLLLSLHPAVGTSFCLRSAGSFLSLGMWVWVSRLYELGCTWGAQLELRKRVVILVCRRDVTAQIF